MQYLAVQKGDFSRGPVDRPADALPRGTAIGPLRGTGLTDLGHFRHRPIASCLRLPTPFWLDALRAQVMSLRTKVKFTQAQRDGPNVHRSRPPTRQTAIDRVGAANSARRSISPRKLVRRIVRFLGPISSDMGRVPTENSGLQWAVSGNSRRSGRGRHPRVVFCRRRTPAGFPAVQAPASRVPIDG